VITRPRATAHHRWAVTVAACGVLAAAAPPLFAAPRLGVTPAVARLDERVVVRVSGLRAGEDVLLRTSTADAAGRTWRAEATFRAGAKGTVDVATDPALGGTYTGVDAMGLFWSARPDSPVAPPAGPGGPAAITSLLEPPVEAAFPRPPDGRIDTRLEAVVAGKTVATATLARDVTTVEVTVTEVREDGLVGRLYEPSGTRRAAVLVLGGSNGGIPAAYASTLAAHGYVTLALAYFRAEGLPKDLVEIPLEYFESGLEWLRARPSVDPEKVAVLGLSRGGELALLLGATFSQVKAVVALAPSHVTWEGAVRDPAKTGLDALQAGRSAWTREGRPLPFLPKTVSPELAARVARGQRFRGIEMMPALSLDAPAAGAAAIAVEKIGGPVLLVSSRDDAMWPAALMSERVVERLKARGFAHRVEHFSYQGCAHPLPDVWLPPAHGGTLGGTAEGTMRAYADYWPRVLAFLERAVGAGSSGR
jgi:dienelactone hydrolase